MLAESPFEFLKAPDFMTPISSAVYSVPQALADTLGKPVDQANYLFGSFAAIFACFVLKEIKHEGTKQMFSIVMGMSIHFFVFGMSAFASFF